MRTWLAVAGFENRSGWYWLTDNQRSMERATCSTRGVLPARGQQQGTRAGGMGCSHLLHCGPACRFFPRNLSLIVFGKSLLLQVGVTQKRCVWQAQQLAVGSNALSGCTTTEDLMLARSSINATAKILNVVQQKHRGARLQTSA